MALRGRVAADAVPFMTVYLRFLSCLARRLVSFFWILRLAASCGSFTRSRLRFSRRVARNTASFFCTKVYASMNCAAPILPSSSSSTSCASSELSAGCCCSLSELAARKSGLSICSRYRSAKLASRWLTSAAKSLNTAPRTASELFTVRDRNDRRVSSQPIGVVAFACSSRAACSVVIVVVVVVSPSSSSLSDPLLAASLLSSPLSFADGSSPSTGADTTSSVAGTAGVDTYCGTAAKASSALTRNDSENSASSATSTVNSGFSKSLATPDASANSLPGCVRNSSPATPAPSFLSGCANCSVAALRRRRYDATNRSKRPPGSAAEP
ncbi:hypothetical protein PybrP1_008754 [[Pythium] brassicae (nom. inval.)]|nr:hypothetical protein PybrP1_008754 [[Pythium] brassicae (nom. inval.)]